MIEEYIKRTKWAYGFIVDMCINKSRHTSYQQQILLQMVFKRATELYKNILKDCDFLKQYEGELNTAPRRSIRVKRR